jgi:redox-sensing transcriptional repressor
MAKNDNIPLPAVRRLSLYLRQLESFADENRRTISSRQLGEVLGLSDAQVRKDLAYFGQFGHAGIGYRVPELIQRVRRILGTDKLSPMLLVGVGNLGRALIAFRGFQKRGFELIAVFDKDPAKIGEVTDGPKRLKVQTLAEMPLIVRKHAIRIGVVAVPASSAQQVAEEMVAAGIRAILNFAPVALQVSPEISVASVDLAIHLEQLSFELNTADAQA